MKCSRSLPASAAEQRGTSIVPANVRRRFSRSVPFSASKPIAPLALSARAFLSDVVNAVIGSADVLPRIASLAAFVFADLARTGRLRRGDCPATKFSVQVAVAPPAPSTTPGGSADPATNVSPS